MITELLGALLAILAISIVLWLVMHRRLLVKYAALWLAVTIGLVTLALVPGVLDALSTALGFQVRSNMLFFAGFGLLLFVTLQMSVELTSVEARLQRLAEELAILESTTNGADDRQDQRLDDR
jgi:hypothetical protein